MFLPYKAVFFILLFFKNHRYSDNSNGFHNLFVKPATVCPHNPFGISIRIALEVPITLRRIYIFPIIESSHPGASCVSWFNQMLFKSFKRVTRFLHIVFFFWQCTLLLLLWYFSYGAFWFVWYLGQLLAHYSNTYWTARNFWYIDKPFFFFKSYSLMHFIFAVISCFHR